MNISGGRNHEARTGSGGPSDGLDGDWALWRDFAVRSAGFPVEGLRGVRRRPTRSERLARGRARPAFREAVAWQSREALAAAVDKLAAAWRSPARVKRRQDVVARYWQRYCAKNDTIGFFGPLGWGRFSEERRGDRRPRRRARPVRVVHFENWAVEAVAAAAGDAGARGDGPVPRARPARAARERATTRSRQAALAALDRLEAARAAVAAAPPDGLVAALDELDRVFEELTGRPAVRADDDSGGGRTVAYLDCMRDLDLTLGGPVLEELR